MCYRSVAFVLLALLPLAAGQAAQPAPLKPPADADAAEQPPVKLDLRALQSSQDEIKAAAILRHAPPPVTTRSQAASRDDKPALDTRAAAHTKLAPEQRQLKSPADADADADAAKQPRVTVDLRALQSSQGGIKAAAILRHDRPQLAPELWSNPKSHRDGTVLAMQANPIFAWQARLEKVSLANSIGSQPMPTTTLAQGDILAAVREQPATTIDLGDGASTVLSSTILITPSPPGSAQPLRKLGLAYNTTGLSCCRNGLKFTGELLIGLVDLGDASRTEALARPIPVQLLADTGTLQRSDLQIHRVGMPYERIEINADNPDDPFTVSMLSQVDPNLPTAKIPVKHPRVALLAPVSLQGLGVEDAPITLSGIDHPLPQGLPLVLDLDKGWLAKRTVVVAANGIASTRLRSTLVGSGTLRLAPGPFVAEPRVIAYTPPWPFLAAMVLGSALGATVLMLRKKRSGQHRRHSRWLDWLVGCLSGIGATAMAYAGMRLPEWLPVPAELTGEVVPFALAFLCAALGARLFAGPAGKETP